MGESNYPDYAPSVAGGAIMAAIFGIELCAHIFNLARKKTWWCFPFLVGALFEVVGYACRALGNKDPYASAQFIIATLAILLAPILFAASVYMFLGRLVRSTGCDSYSMIRTTWLTKIFVGGDITCFLVQAVGAVMITSSGSSSKKTGKNIILFGLVLQVLIFLFFLFVAIVFHRRMNSRGPNVKRTASSFDWQKYIWQLYIVSVFITIRNIFRTVEYAAGTDGYLLTHEWPLYVFDGTLMIFVLAITWFWTGLGTIPVPGTADSASDDVEMATGHRRRHSRAAAPAGFDSQFQNHYNQPQYPQQSGNTQQAPRSQGRHYPQR